MSIKWISASVVVAASAVACYSGGAPSSSQQQGSTGSSCNGQPASCPATPPSYATDVSPVVFQYCAGCHAPGGSQSGKPLDTYASLSSLASNVESKVSDCSMPPSSGAQPSAAERDAILQWIACGAPDN